MFIWAEHRNGVAVVSKFQPGQLFKNFSAPACGQPMTQYRQPMNQAMIQGAMLPQIPQVQPFLVQSVLPNQVFPKIQLVSNDMINKRKFRKDNPLKILKNKRQVWIIYMIQSSP